MARLPSGSVTFVITDIEGSTRLAQALGGGYGSVLRQHRKVLRRALRAQGGVEVDTLGDSTFVAFAEAGAALRGCRMAQRALEAEHWPAPRARPRVRIGVHSGHARPCGGEYVSPEVHRTARVVAAAHGGQVLCTSATARSAGELPDGLSLRDLGPHRLRGFVAVERLFQLVAPGWEPWFPRLRAEPAVPARWPADHPMALVAGAGAGAGGAGPVARAGPGLVDIYPGGIWFLDPATVAGGALPEAVRFGTVPAVRLAARRTGPV
jgi:class 3 adenylate cyclase